MANKAISELPQALNVNNQDLFVLEQSGIAKKLTAETFITEQGIIDALAEALDGHGGIQSVTLASVSGRIRTYLITFTDGTSTTFQVLDGTSIDRIEKTSTAGLVDTYTIFMSDGTTSFFQVTNGSKGDPGVPTDEQVTTAVNTWLGDNVAQETGYVLDRTLTMSNASAPADLVGDLKTKVYSIADLNLFDADAVTENYTLNATGTPTSYTGAGYTGAMPVIAGDKYILTFNLPGTLAQDFYLRVHGYDSDGVWKSQVYVRLVPKQATSFSEVITIPSGISFIKVSIYYYSLTTNIVFVHDVDGITVTAIDKVARNYQEQIDYGVKKTIENVVVNTDEYTRTDLTAGYIQTTGITGSVSGAGYTAKFPVTPGEILTVKKYYLSGGVKTGETEGKFLTVVFFTDNTSPYSGWGYNFNANLSSVTVPDGAYYAQVTIASIMTGTYTIADVIHSEPQAVYYRQQDSFKTPLRYKGSLTANTFQALGDSYCIDNYIISVNCKIDSNFTSIKVGGRNSAGTDMATRPVVEVTPTQVIMSSSVDAQWDQSVLHGLTIEDDLQIIITQLKNSLTCTITIQSKGETWTNSTGWRLGSSYYGFGVLSASSITIDASVSVQDLYKPVWVCGDSWVTYYDTRWYYYALENGLTEFLHSGHAGEGSAEGLTHLKTLLLMFKPRMIVWLYGMNDRDTNDSTPNTAWLNAYNELKTICTNESIELVLATIPTTSSINNNAKNAVVIASGYRYVDEVFAMGADSSGNWITGYKSADGNHTTVKGAKALYAQVLTDVPEIGLL